MTNMDFAETSSGLFVPEYIIRKPKRPIAFDFFAGAGGCSLGFIQAGYEVIGANEYATSPSLTYMVNLGNYPMQIHYIEGEKDKERLNRSVMGMWGIKGKDPYVDPQKLPDTLSQYSRYKKEGFHYNDSHFAGSGWISHHPDAASVKNFWFGDIRKLKGKDILNTLGLEQGDIDVVMGGPPCQGFSKSGKQKIDDPRNSLIYEYARMITELQPRTFIMEEVPDIMYFFDPDGVPVLDKFCLLLQEGGFGKWEMIKKSLLMQAGSAVGIKGKPHQHSVKKQIKKKNIDESIQQELF